MKNIFLTITVSIFITSNVTAQSAADAMNQIGKEAAKSIGKESLTNAAAQNARNIQTAGAAANAEAGEGFMKQCTGNYVYCAMAVASLVQAGMMVADALKSNKTADASKCSGAYCSGSNTATNPGVTGPNSGTLPGSGTINDPLLGELQDNINSNLENLAGQGYSYDSSSGSINTPNGSIDSSTLGSAEGLKSLGMTDSDLQKVAAISEQATKDAKKSKKTAASGFNEDFGGGGSKPTAGPGYDNDGKFNMNKYLAGLMNKNGARGVAGLEKKYGSDQIGVAQDNIFNMIHRRYEEKKSSLNP